MPRRMAMVAFTEGEGVKADSAHADEDPLAGEAAWNPLRRRLIPLTIVAQDPDIRDADGKVVTATVGVPATRVEAGPRTHRFHVVNYDPDRGEIGSRRSSIQTGASWTSSPESETLWANRDTERGRMVALMSTRAGVHGSTDATAVPRQTLVQALIDVADVYTTEGTAASFVEAVGLASQPGFDVKGAAALRTPALPVAPPTT